MAYVKGIENLVSARDVLKSSLEQSRSIAIEINKTSAKVAEINQRLPPLEAAIRNIACKCTLFAIRDPVSCTIGPAASVLKLVEAVQEFGSLLSAHPCSDLRGFLSLVKRLEEASRLLTSNCRLVILWLEDVSQFLADNVDIADEWYLSNVEKSLTTLKSLRDTEERSHCKGGILCEAFGKLENEFRRLLTEYSAPLAYSSSSSSSPGEEVCVFPLPIIQKLQGIVGCLNRNDRLDKCLSIYVQVRISNVQRSLQALQLDYLETTLSEFDSVETVEGYIDDWEGHLEFVVKHLLELEYRLCNKVFDQNVKHEIWMDCFGKIALQSGIHGFIKFGNSITKGKKEAIKLFKLLDIFSALSKLRSDFNRVFGGKGCVEIQKQTRNLIKKVVNGACEIFWELSTQVERQRQTDPPLDGSVPRLVTFVTDYSNELLNDDCRTIMTQVLEIHWIWNHRDKLENDLLSFEVKHITEALVRNLETWAKIYEDATLSYLFMMNARWYLCNNLRGTKLGELLGDSWLNGHQDRFEYYTALYLRESWAKLPAMLIEEEEEGVELLAGGGRAIARDLVKKRIKGFNEAFDEMYRKQSGWVVCDKGLRWKTCQLVVEVVVPVYRSYVEKYTSLVEEGKGSPNKCVKYSAESLETILNSLFQPKLGKHSNSAKYTHFIGKIKDVVSNHFSSTPAAA